MSVLKLARNTQPQAADRGWTVDWTVDSCRLPDNPKAKGLKLRKQKAKLSFIFEAKAYRRHHAGQSTLCRSEQARKLRKLVDQGIPSDSPLGHSGGSRCPGQRQPGVGHHDLAACHRPEDIKQNTAAAYRGLLSQAAAVHPPC